jgi:hypothetical protein
VSPDAIVVLPGNSQIFTATVNGTAAPVTWTVEGADVPGTDIDPAGLLSVAAGETASGLTVRATAAGGASGTALVFTCSTYTVTFDPDGGSMGVISQTVDAGATVAYPEEPTKAGEFFGGWYTNAACTTAYNYGLPVTGDVTLYA